MSQIRLNKTPEIEEVLSFLQRKYRLLSEAEIIKVALSEKYHKEKNPEIHDEEARKAWENLKMKGKKIGERLLKQKGLNQEDMSEEDLYNLLKNV